MLIKGRRRGGGRALADYLLKADNDNVRILGIRGTSQPDSLKYSLIEMSLTSELTKSDKGLYHAQICPAIGEDRQMTMEDWIKSADTLEAELGLVGQKRVLVLHSKKQRLHAHAVWELYDHEKGIMRSTSFNYLAHDRTRAGLERELNHERTPQRNQDRPDMKKTLIDVWRKAKTGQEFIREAHKAGFQVCEGTQRPFMVVDEKTGISFNLVRQLDGIKTQEVRKRLKGLELQPEKQALQETRNRLNAAKLDKAQDAATEKIAQQKQKTHFADVLSAMKEEGQKVTGAQDNAVRTAKAFQENKAHEPAKTVEAERKRKLQEFKEQFVKNLKDKTRNADYEPER